MIHMTWREPMSPEAVAADEAVDVLRPDAAVERVAYIEGLQLMKVEMRMSAAIITSDKIPAEFIGKARAFRDRVAAGERQFLVVRDAIWGALAARQRRKPTFRLPECRDLFRQWQAVKAFGQMQRSAASMDFAKKRVEIIDTRLTNVLSQLDIWDKDAREAGLGLSLIQTVADSEGIRQTLHIVASFNLHALARYWQRAFRPSDEALVAAIWGVVPQVMPILRGEQNEFAIPWPPSGGHWFGQIVCSYSVDHHFVADDNSKPTRELGIRTFHTERRCDDGCPC